MGPFGAWTLLKLCKYYSKVPKRVQRALIGLQKDYFGPKNTGKYLGFAIEKKIHIVQGLLGPPGAPLGLWAPRKILGCHPLSTRLATRGSPLLSVIAIKTTPNYAILRCFLATGTLYLLPKSLRQKYNGLTRQCQGSVRAHS